MSSAAELLFPLRHLNLSIAYTALNFTERNPFRYMPQFSTISPTLLSLYRDGQ